MPSCAGCRALGLSWQQLSPRSDAGEEGGWLGCSSGAEGPGCGTRLLFPHGRYGHFSGINRKVQLTYLPHGRPKASSEEEGRWLEEGGSLRP